MLIFQLFLSGCASLFIKEVQKPHFYSATKNGKTFYILGTFHAFVSIHEMPDYVTAPIEKTDIFLLETLPMGAGSHPAINMRVHLNAGIVRSELEKQDWELFKQIFEEVYGKSPKRKPKRSVNSVNYLIANVIVDAYLNDVGKGIADKLSSGEIQLNFDFMDEYFELRTKLHDDSRLDYELLKIAKKHDRVVDYLDRDIEKLFELDEKINKARLKKRLDLVRKVQKDEKELILSLYKNIRETALFAELYRTGKPIGIDPSSDLYLGKKFAGQLYGDRNKIWLEHLNNIEKGYSSGYLAVGAGHLYGRDNFLTLLQKQGYQIQRVTEQN